MDPPCVVSGNHKNFKYPDAHTRLPAGDVSGLTGDTCETVDGLSQVPKRDRRRWRQSNYWLMMDSVSALGFSA